MVYSQKNIKKNIFERVFSKNVDSEEEAVEEYEALEDEYEDEESDYSNSEEGEGRSQLQETFPQHSIKLTAQTIIC